MSDSPTSRGISRGALVLAAATVVNLPFGTVYAFSVFLKPMEALLGIGRAEMAIVFSMASIFLTIGMLIGPALYRRFAPVPLLLVCGALSASGLLIAAAAQGIEHLLLGYGVLFGLGGGVVFIMMQQGLNQTISPMSGLANGYVVSLYPMGAMLGAPVFGWAIEAFGLRGPPDRPQWFEPAIDLAGAGHGGIVHDTDRLRLWLHFGSDGGCHCALLASQCLWPGGRAVVHCLVHRGHQFARAGRLAVRPDPRL